MTHHQRTTLVATTVSTSSDSTFVKAELRTTEAMKVKSHVGHNVGSTNNTHP